MHRNLLAFYRANDPFSDIKIVSKESLISDWKGKIHPSSIKYILKNSSYCYDNVISMLRYIPYADANMPELLKIKEELINNGLISKNNYLSTFFKDKNIEVIGYSRKDEELNSLFNHFELKPRYIINEKDIHGHAVFKYETVSDEVLFSLNKIAKLLDEGVNINDIYIYTNNDDYIQYLERYSSGFGFSLDINTSKPLYHYEISNLFLNSYKETKNIDESLEAIQSIENKELLEAFIEVINESRDDKLSFEKQIDYIIGELKKTKYQVIHLNNSVKVIDKPIFAEHACVFVLGFAQSYFPKNKKDNQIINDNVKTKLGLNISIIESALEEDMLSNFLMSDNEFVLSYSSRGISEKYFPSPFVDKYELSEKEDPFPDVIYSRDMADFLFAKLLDLKYSFSEESNEYYSLNKVCDIPYGNYDNSFSGVSVFNNKDKMYYSYSKIKAFYQCPFSYYLSNVLEIDPFEGNFNTKIGNVFHGMMEHKYDPDFDFEKRYEIEVAKEEFDIEEETILLNLKEQMREMVNVLTLHDHYMEKPRYILEKQTTLFEFAPRSYLTGKIDKTVILDDKYVILVDYKTGSESFNPKDLINGESMQLPTYCLLAEHDIELKGYPIVGIYINNVIDKSFAKKKTDNLINPAYELNGYTINDLEIALMIDRTLADGLSNFVKSLKLKKDGTFDRNARLMSKEDLNEYKRITQENFIQADKRIRNNDFPINPLYTSEREKACTYCQYRDICFVKSNQRRIPLSAEESEEENG